VDGGGREGKRKGGREGRTYHKSDPARTTLKARRKKGRRRRQQARRRGMTTRQRTKAGKGTSPRRENWAPAGRERWREGRRGG